MGRYNRTNEERFWEGVNITDDCWLWTKSLNDDGYGRIWLRAPISKITGVHRFAYELYNGPIPEGLQVLHKCDVPNCVRREHLFLGTQIDNMKDMSKKGRGNNIKANQVRRRSVCDRGFHDLIDSANRINGTGSCKSCRKEWRRKRYVEKGI